MISDLTWPQIATSVIPILQQIGVLKPLVFRKDFHEDYLFLVRFDGVADATNDITRTLDLHFHTDRSMTKAGEISVQWAQTEEDFHGDTGKHRLKTGPANRPLHNLGSVEFRNDANTRAIIQYIVGRIQSGDFKDVETAFV